MNFKRLLITTMIAASQVAAVLPASADGAVPAVPATEQTETVNPNDSVNQTANPGQAGEQVIQGTDTTGNTNGTDTSGSGQNGTGTNGTTENNGSGSTTTNNNNNTNSTTTPQQQIPAVDGSSTNGGEGKLVLTMNSKKIYKNGTEYIAGHPMEVKKGVSYVPVRAIVESAGLQISFDNNTKETIIQRGTDELRFKMNTSSYKVNGVTTKMSGTSYIVKNNFMIPLTAVTKALNMPYSWDQKTKQVIISISTKPQASFSIGNTEVIAGETQVQYLTNSSSPSGLQIVNEEWTGREDMFMVPGQYVVTYRVQDASGQWSDPFSLTVNVVKPHTPPVANFTTDKDTYKMGELITYNDLSTDEVEITDRIWENKEFAFFAPGPVTIKLTVVNRFGLTSTIEKTINITNETLYTRDDFNKLFTPVGEKYVFDGTQVPSWARANYSFTSEPTTLIRSNSPETVYSDGVVYRETAIGDTRFMIHHVNQTGKNVKMYVIATNNSGESARLTQVNLGFAGPNQYATGVGKASVQRYYESMQTGSKYKDVWIAPGESKIVLTELNATVMKPGEVISLLADVYSDHSLQYNVIMLDANKDPFVSLPYLSTLERDVHNRGTYPDATRNIEYSELIGNTPMRLLLGDNSSDPFLVGWDGPKNGEYALNAGNFGVVYRIKLYRVAPNTLITFNPRGGYYTGSIMVNGNIVQLTTSGGLSAPNENSVLYRTGDREQTVEMLFTAAPGSNLSVNLLFQQMPEKKQP